MASLVDGTMNANSATKPGMMPIKNLAKKGPVGVLKPRCITRLARTFRSTRTRRRREPYIPLVAFCLRHFLADFIICMCEFDFRQAQVGIPGRTSNLLWRATTGGVEQEWKTVRWRVVEPFFELDHMVPAVAEVIEIVDRLGAGLLNDIAEPRLAGIDGLGPKSPSGSGMPQCPSPARNSKRWLSVQPNAA